MTGATQDIQNARFTAAAGVAVVAGAFCAAVAALMLWVWLPMTSDPLDNAELHKLKSELDARPKDDGLKDQIRQFDRQLRQDYFNRQAFLHRGGYLLTGGLAAFLVAGALAASLRMRMPHPGHEAAGASPARYRRLGRWAVGVVTAAIIAAAAVGIATSPNVPLEPVATVAGGDDPTNTAVRPDMPPTTGAAARQAPGGQAGAVALDPNWFALAAGNWHRFRGPGGAGIVASGAAPSKWDGEANEGILWQAALPLEGENSPVVWGDRVFVTGADKTRREVYCFDAAGGKLLWKQSVQTPQGQAAAAPEVMEDTGYAAPTAATNGRCVCAIFANGDLACFDFDGKQLWARNLGPFDISYGYASSLDMAGDMLIVQIDVASDSDGLSKLLAIDARTGATIWETPRPVGGSWASPIIVQSPAGPVVIACGNPYAIAHRLADGKELWRAEAIAADAAPSPVVAGGLALAVNSNSELAAIRMDGSGDVTKTHVAWRASDGIPDIASPLTDGNSVWLLTTPGTLTCYGLADGAKRWEHDLEAEFKASPALAGGRTYLLSTKGVMVIADASAEEYKEIARCELGAGVENVHASPAFAGGRIFIRARAKLWCVGEARASPASE